MDNNSFSNGLNLMSIKFKSLNIFGCRFVVLPRDKLDLVNREKFKDAYLEWGPLAKWWHHLCSVHWQVC